MKTEIEIPNTEQIAEMEAQLAELQAEYAAIHPKIRELEAEIKRLDNRRVELVDYRDCGKIAQLKRRIVTAKRLRDDASCPIYDVDSWHGPRVIRRVTDKYYVLARRCGEAGETYYNRSNGWRMRARSGWDAIDPQKAEAAILAHQQETSWPRRPSKQP